MTVAETLFSPLFPPLTDRQTKGKAAQALLRVSSLRRGC